MIDVWMRRRERRPPARTMRALLLYTAVAVSADALATPAAVATASEKALFAWARSRGARISESVEVRTTKYGGRGLFAASDIPADAALVTIPGDLQLGVRTLALGGDAEIQALARALPWRDVLAAEVTFLPCALALVAERRRGDASAFKPYLDALPATYANAMAPGGDDAASGPLDAWAPGVALRARTRRRAVAAIAEDLAPKSVSTEDLRFASAVVCSRSLTRKREWDVDDEARGRIGPGAALDRSRLLPVIDLVDHGGDAANVEAKHVEVAAKEGAAPGPHLFADVSAEAGSCEEDPFSTSLVAARKIAAGEELLLDYGRGLDRFLLDYGFLPDGAGPPTVEVDLEADLVPALAQAADARSGMRSVGEDEVAEIRALIAAKPSVCKNTRPVPKDYQQGCCSYADWAPAIPRHPAPSAQRSKGKKKSIN